MPTTRNSGSVLVLTALALAACGTNNQNGDLIASAVLVIPPAATAGAPCVCPIGGIVTAVPETDFFNFTTRFQPCVNIINQLPINGNLTSRVNTNVFVIEDVRLNYEATDGSTLHIPETVTGANGTVQSIAAASIPALLVPDAVAAAIPNGTTIRILMVFEGRLLDGSKVKTNQYEYIAKKVAAPAPPATVDACND